MKKFAKILLPLFVLTMVFIMLTGTVSAQFTDLKPTHWCYNKIMDFYENGYIDGYEDRTFLADRTITRAEYVKIVNNFFGYPAGDVKELDFTDLDGTEWFAPYVAEAVKRGYIEGYDDGTFKPYNPIRRQEATVILSRILKIHEETYPKNHELGMSKYSDGKDIDDWAYKAVNSYSVHEFISGYPDGTIKLKKNVTRAETVELLNLLEQKIEIERPKSSTKKVIMPTITLWNLNDNKEYAKLEIDEATWVNDEMACFDGAGSNQKGIFTNIVTRTKNATIHETLSGRLEVREYPSMQEESDLTNRLFLTDGLHTLSANATRTGYKTSPTAKRDVRVDTVAPIVSGTTQGELIIFPIENEDGIEIVINRAMAVINTPTFIPVVHEQTINIAMSDPNPYSANEISGLNRTTPKYAWFKLTEVGNERVGEWKNIELTDENTAAIKSPEAFGTYKLGVSAQDIAGNEFGTLIDGEIMYDFVEDAGSYEDIIVIIGNNPPAVRDLVLYTNVNTPVSGAITAMDTDGDPLTFAIKVAPVEGTATVAGNITTYNPTKAGKYEYTVSVNDGYDTVDAKVTVYVYDIIIPDDPTQGTEADGLVMKVGESDNLIATLVPEGTVAELVWSIPEDENHIDLTADGKVDALEKTDENVEATVTTTVNGVTITKTVEIKVLGLDAKINHEFPTDEATKNTVTNIEIKSVTDEITVVDYAIEDNKYTATLKAGVPSKLDYENLESTIIYERNKTTIKFNGNGNTNRVTMADQVIKSGEKENLSENLFEKEGHTFLGWALTADGEVEYTDEQLYTAADANTEVTLYAVWSIDSYDLTIEYVYEDGKEAAKTYEATLEYDEDYEVTSPKISGYTADVLVVKGTMGTSDVKVTVTYSTNEYTISYELNGGAVATPNPTTYTVETETFTLTNPTKKGYTFVGWTGTGLGGNTVTVTVAKGSTGDRAYTANWSIDSHDLIIEYVYEDGKEAAKTYEATLEYDEDYEVTSPKISGYTADVLVVKGTMGTSDIKVTVTYTANKHNVYFDEKGGSTVEDILDVPYGTTVDVSEVVTTKKGYIFKGWKKDGKIVTEFTMPDNNITLNAEWELDKPDVSIDDFGSTNYKDGKDELRAEPGDTIEYELILTNNEANPVAVTLDFSKDVTAIQPTSLNNINLQANQSITVKVSIKVPDNYEVGKDFILDVDAIVDIDGNDVVVASESTSNEIEKSSTIISNNMAPKNILLVVDLSGSMDPNGNSYRENRIASLKTEAEKFVKRLKNETTGELNLTLIGIGDDKNNTKINGTTVTWSRTVDTTDAFVIGSYDANTWPDLITTIKGLKAGGGTNITGAMEITNDIMADSSYRSKHGIKYSTEGDDFVIVLTDGVNGRTSTDPVAITGKETGVAGTQKNAEYLAAIAFGRDVAIKTSTAYRHLKALTGNEEMIYLASSQTDLDKAFNSIADSIAQDQSSSGLIVADTTGYNGNIYPVVVTHKVGSADVELFRIVRPVTSITWMDGATEITTPIEITETELIVDFNGTAFSAKKDIKIKIGENAPEEEMMLMGVMMFGLTEEPAEEPVVGEEPAEEPAVGEEPVEEPATGEEPTEEPAAGEEPTEEPAVGEEPAEEPAAGEEPAEEPIVEEEPAEEPIVEEEPAEEPAVGEEPVEEPAVGEEPVEEPAVGEEPVEEPAVSEEPAEEPAVGEEPAEEPAVGEEPVEEPIVEEELAEEQKIEAIPEEKKEDIVIEESEDKE